MVRLGFAMIILVEESCRKCGDAYDRLIDKEDERELSPAAMVGSFSISRDVCSTNLCLRKEVMLL